MSKFQLPFNPSGTKVLATVSTTLSTKTALALILVGSLLRLIGLGARPLWFDEVISAVYAQQDFANLVALNSGDNHPIGYYLALKGWITLFGNSETVIRLLSVATGVAALVLVWLIGRRLFPAEPYLALVALALTAFSPFQIYFAQEARNYSFMECFVLATIWFGLAAFENNRWLNWLGLGICGVLGLVSNLTTAFYLVALGLLPLFQTRRYWQNGVLVRLLLTGVGTGLVSGLILLPKLLGRLDAIKGNFWIPQINLLLILHTFYAFIFGAVEIEQFVWALALGVLILSTTLWAVLPACYRQLTKFGLDKSGLLCTLWLLFGPMILIIVVSLLFQPLYLDKALIGCAPFYYLLIAWAIFRPDLKSKAGGRKLITALPVIVSVLLALASLPNLYNGTIAPLYIARYDAVRINDYLSQNYQPGDVVATATDIAWLPLAYYNPNQLPPKYPLKEYPYPNIFPLLVEKMGSEFGPRDEFPQRFGAKRLWVVFEVSTPEKSLKEPPHPADLSGEINWLHSYDWQRDLLAHYERQYQRLQAVALDRVILVLYQV
ncbi:MAG: glycosyltransferase family 39 protein [Chloroflexi bacterium]|nr:glycosyltransferase family 39 protein [Chloroflexota bacterium]